MAAGEGIPGLADKLNHLFATVPGADPVRPVLQRHRRRSPRRASTG